MASCVVDASVLAAVYLDDLLSEASDAALAELAAEGTDLHAPDLLAYEVANAFVKANRRGELTSEDSVARIDELLRWEIEWHPPGRLIGPATALGVAHQLTAYDAAYLGLALNLGAPLLTGDRQLAERSRGAGAPVRLLTSD